MEHEMMDMGHKMKDMYGKPSVGMDKNKMMYPSMHIDHKMPEELARGDVGDMCRLEVVGKIVSKSESDMGMSISIEVHKLGYLGKAGKMNKEEYLSASEEEREKNDKENYEKEPEKKEEE